MDEVLGHLGAEVAAYRSGRSFGRVGRPHHGSNNSEGVFRTFKDSDEGRASAHERHQVAVERLLGVLGVMLRQGCLIEYPKFASDKLQSFPLKAVKNMADVAALDSVGLADNERSI